MTTSSVSGTGTTTTQSALTGSTSIAQTYDQFLKLLTTQLKNQDPLNPTDTAQFTQQLVGFSQVEQQMATNSKLDSLVTSFKMNEALSATNYIDKNVEIETNALVLEGGKATAVYTLEEQATGAVNLVVKDSTGSVVRTIAVTNTMGRHEIAWDGKDTSGNTVPDGTYYFGVSAYDKSGNPLAVSQSMIAKVTGVQFAEEANLLSFGDLNLELSKVLAVQKS